MNVLVTGGAGYIGSHAAQRLLRDGHRVIIVDNLSRGHIQAVRALEATAHGRLSFTEADTNDADTLARLMTARGVDAVMHFAALAYVGESVQDPIRYYRNNVAGSLALLDACGRAGVQRFVFSSTCATYGRPEHIPIPESCPQNPINPYGRGKLHVEHALADFAAAQDAAGRPFAYAALRYFNVAGCDRSGLLGEDHHPETHLIPVILQAMLGRRDSITIHGTDYPTPDGTCIRDYIHVEDLIDAHVAVMEALEPRENSGKSKAFTYNLGIGRGHSVRQVIDAARRVTGRDLDVIDGPPRPGDPPTLYADPTLIREQLGWSAQTTDLDEIIATAWDWFQRNPDGYPQ